MEANNAQKMREVVKALLDVLYDMGIDEETVAIAAESTNCHINSPKVLEAIRDAKYVLAEHPRNCDVGTAGEQSDRFEDYCMEHKNGGSCRECSFNENLNMCALEWAQMPYAKEGGRS